MNKIKQITNYTFFGEKSIMHLITENGDFLRYERDLETGKETWVQIVVPETDSFNNG